jgi:hypothetical protein
VSKIIRPVQLAGDGGLTANQFLSDVLNPCRSRLAGDGGLTADQFLSDVLNPCRSRLAGDGGLTANQFLSDVLNPCRSRLAGDGGLTADQFLSDVLNPCRSRLAGDGGVSGAAGLAGMTSSPAPTGEECTTSRSGRPVGRLALAFAVHAPSRGRVEVLRSGQPGMDAGLAAPGHGWPMAAGPRSRTGARVCRATARHRTKGARALWLLWGFSKVTRCKSGTLSGRYRRNGYVHPQNPHRLTQSLREQARSHRGLQRPQAVMHTVKTNTAHPAAPR